MICLGSGILKLMNCLRAPFSVGLLLGAKERETERNPEEERVHAAAELELFDRQALWVGSCIGPARLKLRGCYWQGIKK